MMFPLTGNEKIKASLEAWNKNRKTPHALLIEGDAGLGKHTLANYLAYSAVCNGENVPCGECHPCRLAMSENHPDIIFISPEESRKNITVSQARSLKNEAYIKPHLAEKRVFVIDGADSMNEQAQNALLKVLEEPPQSVMFILIAKTRSLLLDTVISRCFLLSLTPPETNAAIKEIKAKTEFSLDEVSNALEISKNNIGEALKILKGDTALSEKSARDFLAAMLARDELEMLKVLSRFEKDRVGADKFLKDLKYAVSKEIKANPKSVSSPALARFYHSIDSFEQSLVTNINLNLLFCNVVCVAKRYMEEL